MQTTSQFSTLSLRGQASAPIADPHAEEMEALLSLDPFGFEAGDPNLYRYVGNSPTNVTDPSGLSGKAAHHGYPLYLGGTDATQPLFGLTEKQHTATESVFEKYRVHNHNYRVGNDAARARWAAMCLEQQRAIIIESLQAADVPDSLISQHIDKIMEGAEPGVSRSNQHRTTSQGRVISQDTINKARIASNNQTGTTQGGAGGRVSGGTLRGLAILNVYVTFRDAVTMSGVLEPEWEVEKADYYFIDTDGSVFLVQKPGFFSKPKKKYVAGTLEGKEQVISQDAFEAYEREAVALYGRLIEGNWIRKPRFEPGTLRKTLPWVEDGKPIGYFDKDGPHKFGPSGMFERVAY